MRQVINFFFVTVVLMNLFVAMLSSTYEEIRCTCTPALHTFDLRPPTAELPVSHSEYYAHAPACGVSHNDHHPSH